jgi:hypothetical protein
LIIPPKGVIRKKVSCGDAPEDEGTELLDDEDGVIGEEVDEGLEHNEDSSDSNDELGQNNNDMEDTDDEEEEMPTTGLEQYCSDVFMELKKY